MTLPDASTSSSSLDLSSGLSTSVGIDWSQDRFPFIRATCFSGTSQASFYLAQDTLASATLISPGTAERLTSLGFHFVENFTYVDTAGCNSINSPGYFEVSLQVSNSPARTFPTRLRVLEDFFFEPDIAGVLGFPDMQVAYGLCTSQVQPIVWPAAPADLELDSDSTFETGSMQDRMDAHIRNNYPELYHPVQFDPSSSFDSLPAYFIDRRDDTPAFQPPARFSREQSDRLQTVVDDLLRQGLVSPADAGNPNNMRVFEVRNSFGVPRFVWDAREVNKGTVIPFWSTPNTDSLRYSLSGKIFAKLDLKSGYHQIPLHPDSRAWTAFAVGGRRYVWNVMPLGLSGAPAFFQSVITPLFQHLPFVAIYMDDMAIAADNEDQLFERLDEVFRILHQHNLRLNPAKCSFGVDSITFLGHTISAGRISISKERLQGISELGVPTSQKELRSIVGFFNFFSGFVPNFARLLAPLSDLLHNRVFSWPQEAATAFAEIKLQLAQHTSVHQIQPGHELFLSTDASQLGLGYCLYQRIDGVNCPIAFGSRKFNDVQRRWTVTEQEAYAIVVAMDNLRFIVGDRPVICQTDHRNLLFLLTPQTPKVVRWALQLQTYNLLLQHVPGVTNVAADTLSRLFLLRETPTPSLAARREIITLFHGSLSGHFGVKRTVLALRTAGHRWASLEDDVRAFIKSCAFCQKHDQHVPRVQHPHTTLAASDPFSSIAIDTMGPFIEDEFGFKYLLVFIDQTTRYVEAYPTCGVSALDVVHPFASWISRFGSPASVRSDNGPQFVASIIEELFALFGIEHIRSIAYTPSTNSIVERVNAEIKRNLRSFADDFRHRSWSIWVPFAVRLYNNQVHSAVGAAPHTLVFGTEPAFNRPLILPQADLQEGGDVTTPALAVHEWISRLDDAKRSALRSALDRQSTVLQRRSDRQPEPASELAAGSLVLRRNYRNSKAKFATPWLGPFKVVNCTGVVYRLQSLTDTSDEFIVHAKDIRPYLSDPSRPDVAVAATDTGDDVVDHIVSHTGSIGHGNSYRKLRFRVRWHNCGPEDDEYFPFSVVRHLAALDTYLDLHPELSRLKRG